MPEKERTFEGSVLSLLPELASDLGPSGSATTARLLREIAAGQVAVAAAGGEAALARNLEATLADLREIARSGPGPRLERLQTRSFEARLRPLEVEAAVLAVTGASPGAARAALRALHAELLSEAPALEPVLRPRFGSLVWLLHPAERDAFAERTFASPKELMAELDRAARALLGAGA
jgi:hypothetical protein